MESWLRARYAEGEYFEALGVAEGAGSKEILVALMERRREYPMMDEAWNAIHLALLQERSKYDAARAARDFLIREVQGFPANVRPHFSKASLWARAWKPNETPNPVALRLKVHQEAAEWQRVEQTFANARQQLATEYGEAIFALLDHTTNWQEVRKKLPDTPLALEQFTQNMLKTGRSSAAELPPLEISSDEIAHGQAKRSYVTKAQCGRCANTRRVRWTAQDLVNQWDTFVEEHPEFLSVSPAYRGTALSRMAIEGPCPECTGRVIFPIPDGAQVGWVLQGRDKGGKIHFARLGSIVQQEHTPKPVPPISRSSAPATRSAPEWLEFVLGCIFWTMLAYLVGSAFLTPSSQRAMPGYSSRMLIISLISFVLFVAWVLWVWLPQRKK
ncbi:MAG: hypothetical protein H5T66_00275 [Chloroflexi bacterium]|nr:hypothetical protein [Chloroflexota bacterium]